MTVRVKLFAVAKQLVGADEVVVEVASPATLGNVQSAVTSACPQLNDIVRHSRWAVDAEFAGIDRAINESSEIALIPPVSGG
jgi:molybdopterin converting factor small subunit